MKPSVLGKETLPNTHLWLAQIGLGTKMSCHQKPERCYCKKEFMEFIRKPLDPVPQHPTALWWRMVASVTVKEMET